jgi:hypothetical protein
MQGTSGETLDLTNECDGVLIIEWMARRGVCAPRFSHVFVCGARQLFIPVLDDGGDARVPDEGSPGKGDIYIETVNTNY